MNKLQRSLEKAIGLMQQRRHAEARPLVKDLAKKAPRHPLGWNLLGVIASEDGEVDEAIDYFEKAVELAPRDAGIRSNLGEAYRMAGRAEDAAACLEAALSLDPGLASTLVHHGLAMCDLDRPGAAVASLESALQIDSDLVEAHQALGRAHLQLARYQDALAHLRRAQALSPDNPKILNRLGTVLLYAGRFDEAREVFRRLHETAPDELSYVAGQVAALERKGEYDAAYALLRPYVERGIEHPLIAASFVTIARRVGREAEARETARRVLDAHGESVNLLFALGKLNDDLENFDEAFDCYRRGNALKAPAFELDSQLARHERIIATFSREQVAALPRAPNRSEVPVFVVGMPRSGTTLVEQIVASHPRAFGAGELTDLNEVAQMLGALLGASKPYPEAVAAADAEKLDRIANRHLERLASLSGGAERVVDKLPSNYQRLGLVAMLFPRARIVHCRRNALDTCLSCYFQNFFNGNEYSYDLSALGAYYHAYDRLMAHWREVFDLSILDVQYEELVADQEAKSRELIDFLGLEWDARCLAFHENERVVRTASYDQVRRPIYDRSVNRYRHYEHHLGQLKKALGLAA
jgi:Flp pilus assembly protein TadD